MTKRLLILAIFCLSFTHTIKPVAGRELFNGDAFPIPCSTCTNNPGDCAISEAGSCQTCGTSSSLCCDGGATWTKYDSSCRVTNEFGNCNWVWVKGPRICSTGNKCVAGETGLRAGQCNCGYSQDIYKTCCSGATAVACQNYAIQDGIYPPEGTCGGAREVPCGGANQPACGNAACSGSPTNTPGPTPTPGGPTFTPAPTDLPPPPAGRCNDVGGTCYENISSCDAKDGDPPGTDYYPINGSCDDGKICCGLNTGGPACSNCMNTYDYNNATSACASRGWYSCLAGGTCNNQGAANRNCYEQDPNQNKPDEWWYFCCDGNLPSIPTCNPDNVTMTITPNASCTNLTYHVSGAEGSTYLEDYLDGVRVDIPWNTDKTLSFLGDSVTWVHKWRNCSGSLDNCGPVCEKSLTHTCDTTQPQCVQANYQVAPMCTQSGDSSFAVSGLVTDNIGLASLAVHCFDGADWPVIGTADVTTTASGFSTTVSLSQACKDFFNANGYTEINVDVLDQAGNSSCVEGSCYDCGARVNSLRAPTDLTATCIDVNVARLSWVDDSCANNYAVRVDDGDARAGLSIRSILPIRCHIPSTGRAV